MTLLFALGAVIGLAPRAGTQLARFNYVTTGIVGATLGGLLPQLLLGEDAPTALRMLAGIAIGAAAVIGLSQLKTRNQSINR
ncbi:putative membrane protein YeaQ/YmgE (transglycosylase-associated protein family) [Sphingomonas kyeonggiensis]|uniref:Putative membrane protein YeaQ/YmgE (Transglycosylase-associated protein family) n=1 Tax=Sphingomonas kyeonggiensis TaxID=1268553 RepID=A0A7W7NU95_9SPHN|nr:hypothetical protein [Sphingomonas kyeonggiensis]MBB4840766.1 putative membrane protein YeaQ/YmgE (transglycosylase-associated protein family) [Sphingomonas kyeonggiensis]